MGQGKLVNKKLVGGLGILCVALAAVLSALVINDMNIMKSKDSQLATFSDQENNLQSCLEGNITAYRSYVATHNYTNSDYNDYVQAHSHNNSEYDDYVSNHTHTNSECQGLIGAYNSLSDNYSLLETNRASLFQNYTDLTSKFENLTAEYSDLENTYQSLQVNYSNLNSEFTSLEAEYSTLQTTYQNLVSQYTSLSSNYNNLQAEYSGYIAAYQRLRELLSQRWDQMNVEPFVTSGDSAVRDVVYQITGGWSNHSDWNEYWNGVKAMYDWVVQNVEYRYDGLTPMLPYNPSGNLQYCTDMWQFPNETLNIRKGDCEDQAILLCSMIRCYNNMSYWVECICLNSVTNGHVGVQLPVTGTKLVILDPAGRYYSHDSWGNIAYNDITTEINNWLNYWKPQMGQNVYVDRVFSDYIDKSFTSTSEYTTWMYSR